MQFFFIVLLQDRTQPLNEALQAILQEIDHLRSHLVEIAVRDPDAIESAKNDRADHRSLLEDVVRRKEQLEVEVTRRLRELDSETPSERSAAQKALLAIGKPALPFLERVVTGSNAHLKSEAATLVRAIRGTDPICRAPEAFDIMIEVYRVDDIGDQLAEEGMLILLGDLDADHVRVTSKNGILVVKARKADRARIERQLKLMRELAQRRR